MPQESERCSLSMLPHSCSPSHSVQALTRVPDISSPRRLAVFTVSVSGQTGHQSHVAPRCWDPREHARALHAAVRFCARRTVGGRRVADRQIPCLSKTECRIGNHACGNAERRRSRIVGMKVSAIEPGVLTLVAGTPAAHSVSESKAVEQVHRGKRSGVVISISNRGIALMCYVTLPPSVVD